MSHHVRDTEASVPLEPVTNRRNPAAGRKGPALGGSADRTAPWEQFDLAVEDLHRAGDLARMEIARADAKAASLAAIAIPIAGILLAVPSLTTLEAHNLVLAWTAASFMLLGVGYLGSVVWPNLRGNVGISFVSATSPEQLVKVSVDHSQDPDERRTYAARESNLLARLATAKFRRVQKAILCLGTGTLLIFVICISVTLSVHNA